MNARYALLLPFGLLLLDGCNSSSHMAEPAVDLSGFFVDATNDRLPAATSVAIRAAAGDLDNDGDLDILVAPGTHTGPEVIAPQDFLFHVNNGAGIFANEASTRLPGSAFGTIDASAVILGDVDGDSDLDAFVANGVTRPGLTGVPDLLWINDGAGVFTDESAARLPEASYHSLHAAYGDVDNDGDLDIVVGVIGRLGISGQNRLLINDGAGVFTDETSTRLPALLDITLALALADLDGDADIDIVVANRRFNGSRVLMNNGIGVFTDETAAQFTTPPPFAGDVVVTDINGDGAGDIIFTSFQGGPLVFINDGGGQFTEETTERTPTFIDSHGVAVADVDLDGDVDLFNSVPGAQNCLLLNDGRGYFSDVSSARVPETASIAIRYPIFADIDNDGDPDLYLPESIEGGSNQDLLWLNVGSR